MTMKNMIRFSVVFTLACLAAFGQGQFVGPTQSPQYAPLVGSTTLSGTVTSSSRQICVASATGIVVPSLALSQTGSLVFIDTETMQVLAQGVGTTCFVVRRGVLGTPAVPHINTSVVWFGSPDPSSGDTSRPFGSNLFAPDDAQQLEVGRTPFPYGAIANTTAVAGTLYYSQLYVPNNQIAQGACVLNGSTVGTDNHLIALYDYTGKLVANSNAAGALAANASLLQCFAFVIPGTSTAQPIELSGPATYYLAEQSNGTTATLGLYVTGNVGTSYVAGSVTGGSFGTIPQSITIAETFTTAKGPIGTLY
jgi:hypothetical protein